MSRDPKNAEQNTQILTRRRVIRSLAVGGGLITGTGLPARWHAPVVQSVVTPVHAQSSFVMSCEANPPSGSTVPVNVPVSVVVTITPNPGAGQPVMVQGFCDGGSGFDEETVFTDANGRILDSGTLGFCSPGDEACVRYSYGGAFAECCWTADVEVNCLVHGSLVLLPGGRWLPVEELQVGMMVHGYPHTGSAPKVSLVTKVVRDHWRSSFYHINDDLLITHDHPVLVEREGRLSWCPVETLAVGDLMQCESGLMPLASCVEQRKAVRTVYVETSNGNMIVGPEHRYVVGSTYAGLERRNVVAATEFA